MNTAKPLITSRRLLFGLAILALLLVLLSPLFSLAAKESVQNKSLQQAKGIFYGLKMFAIEHNGHFPSVLDDDFAGDGPRRTVTDANHAYANVVPNYVQSERPFIVPPSAYCQTAAGKPSVPNDDFSDHRKVLAAGQNHFAYVLGLAENSDPSWPIIADGFAGGPGAITNPAYSRIYGDYGAAWGGRNAIVVNCNGSARIQSVYQDGLVVLRAGRLAANLFTPSTDPKDPWLTGCTVLNPLQNH